MSPAEVDLSIEQTLGNFCDAAPLFGTDTTSKQFIGITNFPTTPIAPRQMPPLAYTQLKQPSSSFVSNGSAPQQFSAQSGSSRTHNNNNNNNNTLNNNTATNNVNYQPKQPSSASLQATSQQSRTNSSITSSSNTFVRPPDSKPLLNGRPSYSSNLQLSKHEVFTLNSSCCL